MDVGVGGVLELTRHEPAVGFGKLTAFGDHPHALLFLRCQDDFGTQESHEFAALNREGLDHYRHEWVALGSADHRQSDAGIPRCGLDHGLARLQFT